MIFLETQRLFLRNVEEKDADTIFDYRNNEICAKYQRGQVKTKIEIQNLVQKRKNDKISAEKRSMLAVSLKNSDEMIGEIVVLPAEKTFSLGYTFSYKFHRKGYAFEAISALMEFLHENYADFEFICFCEKENQASKNLLQKLGYKYLGYSQKHKSEVFGKWLKTKIVL